MPDMTTLAETIQRLEFDSTFTISADGTVTPTDDMAPECFHVESTGADPAPATFDDIETWPGWSSALVGMSGQYLYTGGVMHASEFIGRAIAERLVESYDPGTVFALVTVEVLEHDEDSGCLSDEDDEDSCVGGHEPAGWTILARAAHA